MNKNANTNTNINQNNNTNTNCVFYSKQDMGETKGKLRAVKFR